jgi:Dolichyl-phosphate-mannose-protein mannosyltransferase
MPNSYPGRVFRFSLESRGGQNLIVIPFILFFFLINVLSVRGKHLTTDEPGHFIYGQRIINGDSTRGIEMSKMPVSAWNALPSKLASYLPENALKGYLKEDIIARLMTTLFSLAVAVLVFHWSRELYGFIPALASLTLYVLDPNIIAHSQLIATDIYAAGAIAFSAYWLWRFARTRRWQDGLCFAVVLGLAQLAKYTSLSLYPLFAIAMLVSDIPVMAEQYRTAGKINIFFEVGRYIKYIVVVASIGILVINIGFLFNRTFRPLKDYDFQSKLFKSIQAKIDFIVPTPYPYLSGFDWILYDEETSFDYGNLYLLGQTHSVDGFKGYYFIASVLKTPIPTQIILLASAVVYFINKQRRKTFLQNEWFLIWLVAFYTVYFNFFYNTQTGIRYYLVIFPLLYIFAGGLFSTWKDFTYGQKTMSFVLGLYLAISVLSYYPNYLAYFNEIVWDRKMAYKYLADSNIEWGQDINTLKDFRTTKRIYPAPEKPYLIKGNITFYLSVNKLVGVTSPPGTYAWLRNNFEPTGMIAPSYLLFEFTPEKMRDFCGKTNYCK